MDWKYVKELSSIDLINEYEGLVNYTFNESFKNCVKENNGGRPAKKVFNTNKAKERELKSFLSFNHDDKETVWKIFEWNKEELANKYVPFAIDNFGNIIGFDSTNDKIIFLNHEDMSIELIADNFDDFLNALYE